MTFALTFSVPVSAGDGNLIVGLKGQYATLARTLKLEDHRTKTPQSDGAWVQGMVFNASYDRFFLGASYTTATFTDLIPATVGDSTPFKEEGKVAVSELDLAIGYTIAIWASPYIGYLRHHQQTEQGCVGCDRKAEIGDIGVGLLVNYPLDLLLRSRWAVYLNAALIRGLSMEGGLSYAGIRWPVVGVVGYAYRRIDYPSGKYRCGTACSRDSDVFAGPTLMIDYTF